MHYFAHEQSNRVIANIGVMKWLLLDPFKEFEGEIHGNAKE
jgi:hypothetical protein